MTAAEYRALREACGLSAREAAVFHRVAEPTIVKWETNQAEISAVADGMIKRLNARIESAVLDAVDAYAAQHDLGGLPDAVLLIRYQTEQSYATSRSARDGFPHACHDALVTRTEAALKRIGARIMIIRR